jgi:predicted MPP superfamily phosphohydrolase
MSGAVGWLLAAAAIAAAIVGQFSILVFFYNRLHAVAWPRRLAKLLERVVFAAALVLAAAYVLGRFTPWGLAWLAYSTIGWAAAGLVIPLWLIPKLRERRPAALLSNDTEVLDVRQRLGRYPVRGLESQWFARLPGNELLRISIPRKTLLVASLPAALDGLTIAHLSDLHMTGKLDRDFYDLVVDETNALAPDLIAITGDILEKAKCLPWIQPTLGRLKARYGTFFILGNHELKLGDAGPLRQALTAAGLIDLGGRSHELEINGAAVRLVGNELPWFGNAEFKLQNSESSFDAASTASAPSAFCIDHSAFSILLSHSPDQLPWARRHGFPLMLAGHNHGGQIRLPWLGALITPSLYGWRYAGGLYEEPPTLLHVSRGLAGVHPIRLNCPPELALLKLQSSLASRPSAGTKHGSQEPQAGNRLCGQ